MKGILLVVALIVVLAVSSAADTLPNGLRTDPFIDTFAASDQSTGSTLFTNSATVNITLTGHAPDGSIAGYAVTESQQEPETWLASPIAVCTITGVQGEVTLYGWVKGPSGSVASKSATIYYSTAVAVVSNITVTDNHDGTATVAWTTNVPALGAVKYGPVKLDGSTPFSVEETSLTTAHSVMLTIVAGTNYKIVPVNNEVVSPAIYWPSIWPVFERSCLCADGKINILDMIFVRNCLGQDPSSGHNACADMNHDGKINILDLLLVRNKLGTVCP